VLVELSVMEQRYQAVLTVVQDGWKVTEVARRLGVSSKGTSHSVLIAGGVLVAAILVAVILPHHCYVSLGPCLPGGPCTNAICSGFGAVPRFAKAI
jgi:hypothetical protein